MDISQIINKQREYFDSGVTLDTHERVRALKRLAAVLDRRENDILAALHQDLRKSEIESRMTEICMVRNELDYMIRHLKKWSRKQRKATSPLLFPAQCYQVPEPFGVVLILSPWNYPFLLSFQPLISAIAAGNCVVLKPSAYAPATSALCAEIVADCFPTGHCAVIQGSREENQALLSEKFDSIFFTGSPKVGHAVMEAASRYLTPVTLELGGKSPVLLDQTADIRLAARRLVFGKLINAGQTCIAPDHIYVPAERQNALIQALIDEIEKQYPRNSTGTLIDYPKIINLKHFKRLLGLIDPKKIAYGGKSDESTLTIEPTILRDVSESNPVMGEEIFGPIFPIIPYQNIEEAFSAIHARPRPLAFYLFSADSALIHRVERTVPFGGGCINDTIMHVSTHNLPFGGIGDSGMGQYHGKAGFDVFTHYKSIVNKGRRLDPSPRYRPYPEPVNRLLKIFRKLI